MRDPLGREVRYEVLPAPLYRLMSVTDPAGGVTRYTYDAAGRMESLTDARGITFLRNEYSASGRVIRQTQADGASGGSRTRWWGRRSRGPGVPASCPDVDSVETVSQGYQVTGGRVVATTVTTPRGQRMTTRFNAAGYMVERIDAQGQSTRYERAEGTNVVLSTTDPLGRVTRFTYDGAGNVTSITDPDGNVRTFTYDGTLNVVTTATDALAQVTRFEYDAQGNLTATVDPLNQRTAIAYNATGQPASVTDPLGNVTQFGYDTHGNLATVTDPLGNVTTREYDAVGRRGLVPELSLSEVTLPVSRALLHGTPGTP